jgi:O-antigen/teichoic acid export membrane protein
MLKRLVGYAAYMLGATSAARLITFAVGMLGARIRSKENFGDYATYVLIYGWIQNLLISGVNQTVQRFSADRQDDRVAFAGALFKAFLVLTALLSFAGLAFGLRTARWAVALGLFGGPWVTWWMWGRFLVRTRLEAKHEAVLVLVASLANSGFQFLFLWLTSWVDALIYGDFVALLASGVVTLAIVPRALDVPWTRILREPLPAGLGRDATRFALPLWGSGQVYALGQNIASAFTRLALGAAPLGALNLMAQLWQFAYTPMDLLSQAALPALVGETRDRGRLFRELVRLCLVVFPPIAIAVAGGVPLLLRILGLADKWYEIPLLLQIYALEVPARAFQMVANQYSVGEGRPRVSLWAHLAHAAMIAAAILPLARAFGIYGVVIAEVLGMLANAALFAALLWRDFRADMKTGVFFCLRSSFATALALAPIVLFRDWPFAPALSLICAGAYLGAAFLLGLARTSDLGRLARAVRGHGLPRSAVG